MQLTCKLFWDHHHLLAEVWPTYFGPAWSGELKDNIKKICFATTVAAFEAVLQLAQQAACRNPKYLKYIDSLSANRFHFASYCIEAMPGTLGRHGSLHAEQNHSSVISYLGPVLYDDSTEEIKNLLGRHAKLCSLHEQQLTKYGFSFAAECTRDPYTTNPALMEAKLSLQEWGYELFEAEYVASKKYHKLSSCESGQICVAHECQPD
jgi:hypothetical protein